MKMQKGKRYVVYVHLDEESYRIVASAKVEHFLSTESRITSRVRKWKYWYGSARSWDTR